MTTMQKGLQVIDLIKCPVINANGYHIISADPCKGILYVTEDNPEFLSGHIRVRGKDEGRYPYNYLEMIDRVFGPEPNTIEVCSRTVQVDNIRTAFTVDINPAFNPSAVTKGEVLAGVPTNHFNRWRSDPPYNDDTAESMYKTDLPKPIDLLKAGARVCKIGALMFLLLGPTNYQWKPEGVKRIGLVYISVIPNNETRALNIYVKLADSKEQDYQTSL